MLEWITGNLGTLIIGFVLLIAVILAIRSIIKDRKKGTSCSCGCSGCVHSDSCHHVDL